MRLDRRTANGFASAAGGPRGIGGALTLLSYHQDIPHAHDDFSPYPRSRFLSERVRFKNGIHFPNFARGQLSPEILRDATGALTPTISSTTPELLHVLDFQRCKLISDTRNSLLHT